MRWLAIGLIGCAAAPRPAPRPVVPPPAPTSAAAPVTAVDESPPPVKWANIVPVDNCFYFSAPFIGRDEDLRGSAELSLENARASLRLASAVFEGTLADDMLDVSRTTAREHEGTYTVTETIAGSVRDGQIRARYRYEECGPEGCPGRCTLTADLSGPITVRRR